MIWKMPCLSEEEQVFPEAIRARSTRGRKWEQCCCTCPLPHSQGLGHVPRPRRVGVSDLTQAPHSTDEQAWALGRDGICARSVGSWEGAEAQMPVRWMPKPGPFPGPHCTVSFLTAPIPGLRKAPATVMSDYPVQRQALGGG